MTDYEQKKNIIKDATCSRNVLNPITAKELSYLAHIPITEASSSVRKIIRILIDDGNPIASNKNGYFLVNNATQYNEYIESLDSRIEEINKRKTAFQTAYKQSVNLEI